MNRYLLAGCAAVALAFGAGAANAQAKFEVKIGGDAYFEGGYVDQDLDAGLRSTEFRNRFRLNIVPTAKADNGLEYGGRVRIRASSGAATVDGDRAYIFAQGTFGQVRLGVTNSFNDDTYASRPFDYQILGIYDPYLAFVPNAAGTLIGGTSVLTAQSITANGNATKIAYYSPRFAGLQLGASYTPRSDSVNTDVNRLEVSPVIGTALSPATAGNYLFQDIIEVGANYKGQFGGFTVAASAAYFWGESETTLGGVTALAGGTENLRAWQVGGNVGYAGFSVGGGFVSHGDSGQPSAAGALREDAYSWNVGAQYKTGPVVVGAAYIRGEDSGSFLVAGERELSVINVGALYTVAPGLTVGLEYNYFDLESDVATADDKGSVVIVRSALAF